MSFFLPYFKMKKYLIAHYILFASSSRDDDDDEDDEDDDFFYDFGRGGALWPLAVAVNSTRTRTENRWLRRFWWTILVFFFFS